MVGGTTLLAATDAGDAVGALMGTAIAGGFWLAVAFRSFRLRDENSPKYVGLYRWTGEQVQTRRRAVICVVLWSLVVFVMNLLILG